ncbi:MAG TPA: hypothetical protein PLD88_05065 [Candidatus Berkiella sp.]|nr:hypothetical protein [Candidatus Berkiella sp.]
MSIQGPNGSNFNSQMLLLQALLVCAPTSTAKVSFPKIEKPVNEAQLRQQALYKNTQNPKNVKPTYYEHRDTPMNRRPGNKGNK